MIAPILFGLVGLAVLLNLGAWQMRRLHWKEGVIAAIDARLAAAPVALPADPLEARDEFLAVRAEGRFLPGEIHVLSVRGELGTGFRIIAPFETDGRRIMVDRGFVPEWRKGDDRPLGSSVVTGNLHWPDEKDGDYTPPPDPARDIWFARDVAEMATALEASPVLLVARSVEGANGDVALWPVDSRDIRNNHLNYAITWFLLAAGWLGMTLFWLWRIRHRLD